MTCEDCVHYEVCVIRASQFKSVGVEVAWDENSADVCAMAREKSSFVELLGDEIIYTKGKWLIH